MPELSSDTMNIEPPQAQEVNTIRPISFHEAASEFEWRPEIVNSPKEISWDAIEHAFRHDPNMQQMDTWIKRDITEEEFWNLVFFQGAPTQHLYQSSDSRLLREVAQRALALKNQSAESTYIQDALQNPFASRHSPTTNKHESPFFLREPIHNTETTPNASYYIHEGNSALLGYAMHLLETGDDYTPIKTIIGTKSRSSTSEETPPLQLEPSPLVVEGYRGRESVPSNEIQETFKNAEQIYFVLPDKIGDSVAALGFIRTAMQLEIALPQCKSKERYILAPLNLHPLLEETCHQWNIHLLQAPPGTGVNRAEYQASNIHGKTAIVFELDSTGNDTPEGFYFGEGKLVIRNLLESYIARYGISADGPNRQRRYMADLIGIDYESLDPRLCQPQFTLQENDDHLQQLIEKYDIDPTKPQVALIIEASESGRQYSLENWGEVLKKILELQPEASVNIIFDKNKNPNDETFIDRDHVLQVITNHTGLSADRIKMIGEPLLNVLQLMRMQSVVLSNDTGLPHLISTANLKMPRVVTLFTTPHANPNNWIQSPNVTPITPPEDISRSLKGGIYCTTDPDKWINLIEPAQVAGAALAVWK